MLGPKFGGVCEVGVESGRLVRGFNSSGVKHANHEWLMLMLLSNADAQAAHSL